MLGSWGRAGARPQAEKGPQEFVRHALDVVTPLEDRHILGQVPLAHAPEWSQEVAQARPQALLGVAVRLAHPVTVPVQGPGRLRPRTVDRPVDPLVPAAGPGVAPPLVSA